jgi:hypothetical protein
MGAIGTTTIDFGAFPGASDASVAVTGQAGIVAGSLVEAWLRPAATADHSADEHLVESLRLVAGNIVAGTGFTVYGFNTSDLFEPLVAVDASRESQGGRGTRIYGLWTVAWAWN